MCLTSQTCEKGLKSVQKCDLYKMTNFSSNCNYSKLIPILLQLNKFDNHSSKTPPSKSPHSCKFSLYTMSK